MTNFTMILGALGKERFTTGEFVYLNVDAWTAEQLLGGHFIAAHGSEVKWRTSIHVLLVDIRTLRLQVQDNTVVWCGLQYSLLWTVFL